MSESSNNSWPSMYTAGKAKARLIVLLDTVTDHSLEKCRSSIHEDIKQHPHLYSYYLHRLILSTFPFTIPQVGHDNTHRSTNYPTLFKLLKWEIERAARDPSLAYSFTRALCAKLATDLIDKMSSLNFDKGTDCIRLLFDVVTLRPLEGLVLASSFLVHGNFSPNKDLYGGLEWNLKNTARNMYGARFNEARVEFSRPQSFEESDMSPQQAVAFISTGLKVRLDGDPGFRIFLTPALVKYGTRIIQPLLKANASILLPAREQLMSWPFRFDAPRLTILFSEFGLVQPSPDRDRRALEIFSSLYQLESKDGVVVGWDDFVAAVDNLQDSNLPQLIQLLSEREHNDGQRELLEMPDLQAQCALDLIHVVLQFPELVPTIWEPPSLRRLSLRLSLARNLLPSALFLTDVTCEDKENRGAGGFADIFCGMYNKNKVALKCLRVYQMMEESERTRLKRAFYHESLLWLHMRHKHVCPFWGINEELFPHSPCMVLPWAENGNIRHYLDKLRAKPDFVGPKFLKAITKWLYQIALGLAYLHGEDVIHGDLRGVNVLVEADGTIRLSDFGLSVIAEATNSFSSSFRGGAFGWLAPEIVDPEQYGLASARPTFASDAYSFGCVCVELFTCQSPYAGLSDTQIIIRVLRGRRPPRPAKEGEEMSDDMWELTNRCWKEEMADRPSASQIVDTMEDIVRE